MKGKNRFTNNEINQLKILIEQKVISSKYEQKKIRDKIRKIGFYFTDFSNEKGYTVNDLEVLINSGLIVIVDKEMNPKTKNLDDEKALINLNSSNKKTRSQSDSKITGDITKISFLVEMCFKNIGSLDTILENGLPKMEELNKCGLYSITIPSNYQVGFIPPEECIGNNVINPWSIQKLKDKWVDDVDVVYYGIAGKQSNRSLRQRLTDLKKHGFGNITDRGPHKGGEIMWQLNEYKIFSLLILPTEGPPTPRNLENKILHAFYDKMGKLPFANRQF